MTDSDSLKREIQNSGLKMKYLAEQIGITLNTFSRKVNGKAEFNGSEIVKLSALLGFTAEQRDSIFFNGG